MNQRLIPKKVFFTSGVGRHSEYLESFELALRDAGIEKFNLVTVSSILPPKCKIVSKEDGLRELASGEIVFAVLSRNASNEQHRVVSTAVGCAIPKNPDRQHGYLSEHHSFGESMDDAAKYAEKLAVSMYSTWTKEEPERETSVSRSAEVEKDTWTTVVSAAVFVL